MIQDDEPTPSATNFISLMALESIDQDTYLGVSPEYPWGRVYGGLVVAQGLRAALATVGDDYLVHSLHAYFIRGGTSDEPIRYEVDRIRNGRSFVTRRVVAHQSDGAILNLSCSFQTSEKEADVQESAMPTDVGEPGSGNVEDWDLIGRRVAHQSTGRSAIWLRVLQDLGDHPSLQACALAYASDDIPTDAIASTHPEKKDFLEHSGSPFDEFFTTSLDHAIWFHRPLPTDQWLLHDHRSHGLANARGLAIGEVFAPSGVHVATVAQEILFRELAR